MHTERSHRSHAAAAPRMWSPPTLHARLNAERMVAALQYRSRRVAADARERIRRIVAQVEGGQTEPDAAIAQLRALTGQLRQHCRNADARRGPRCWELLTDSRARWVAVA